MKIMSYQVPSRKGNEQNINYSSLHIVIILLSPVFATLAQELFQGGYNKQMCSGLEQGLVAALVCLCVNVQGSQGFVWIMLHTTPSYHYTRL